MRYSIRESSETDIEEEMVLTDEEDAMSEYSKFEFHDSQNPNTSKILIAGDPRPAAIERSVQLMA